MKIRRKLTLYFALLTGLIVCMFALIVYLFYTGKRQDDFGRRLEYKAVTTATLLLKIPQFDKSLVKIIDENTLTTIQDPTVVVLDSSENKLYSNRDDGVDDQLIRRFKNEFYLFESGKAHEKYYYKDFSHVIQGKTYRLLISGRDNYGENNKSDLLLIMIISLIISLILVFVSGLAFSNILLKPIRYLVTQSNEITPSTLSKRLVVNTKDEIQELSDVFNNLLSRIEWAFNTEKYFILNASHELRTPVTSIKGQIDVTLAKKRELHEYESVLRTILEDTDNIILIINGFLDLAEANQQRSMLNFTKIRIDDILFSIKDDLERTKPDYKVKIDLASMPEDDKSLIIMGNQRLVQIMLNNLVENACKFSENKTANLNVFLKNQKLSLEIIDHGIGIPENELENIYSPLYRAENAKEKPGHGIGLAIVKRIADIHGILVEIDSKINMGTKVKISFP
jgi:two-component system, OmpR family, sensor histidine kinase ArlS